MCNVSLGKKGEDQAAASLESAGMTIIARNFKAQSANGVKLGEIDIIAIDKDTVVFTEVKTWTVYSQEDLLYGIDAKKQRKIIKTAKYFLSENRKYNNMAIRFDVIFVKDNSVNHLVSAFTESV